MRKIIGILGVAVLAATMFFSANNVTGSSSDASLASLIAVNTANAEIIGAKGCSYTGVYLDTCYSNGWRILRCVYTGFGNNCSYNY